MNRYNPYQNPYESPQSRRGGGPPNGFGPDRSHRFDSGGPPRGRGFGRGRGRGSSHGSQYSGGHDGGYAQYDQGSSQGDMGGYNSSYESAPGQDSYYQNGNFNANNANGPGQYSQDYGGYEGALISHVENDLVFRPEAGASTPENRLSRPAFTPRSLHTVMMLVMA